jgi:hypothetical protein
VDHTQKSAHRQRPRLVRAAPVSAERCDAESWNANGDALETILPDRSEAIVALLDEDCRTAFHRRVWLVRFRIVEGEKAGALISWWLRALDKGKGVSRASAIATSFVASTGLRPPRDLARRRPSWWLADSLFRVRTRQVRRDIHKVARPEEASYSVVEAILERLEGSPPALQERSRDR